MQKSDGTEILDIPFGVPWRCVGVERRWPEDTTVVHLDWVDGTEETFVASSVEMAKFAENWVACSHENKFENDKLPDWLTCNVWTRIKGLRHWKTWV